MPKTFKNSTTANTPLATVHWVLLSTPVLVLTWTDQRRKLVPGPIAWHSHHTAPLTESCGMGTDGCTVFSKSKNELGPNALFDVIMIWKSFKQIRANWLLTWKSQILNCRLPKEKKPSKILSNYSASYRELVSQKFLSFTGQFVGQSHFSKRLHWFSTTHSALT